MSKEDMKYLESVRVKMQELEQQQTDLYNLAIKTLGIEDTDDVFDYLYNGVEIYEGDIVEFNDSEISLRPVIGRAEVIWCNDLIK